MYDALKKMKKDATVQKMRLRYLETHELLSMRFPAYQVSIAGSLRDREVAYSASDRQGSNFESCVWRTVSSQSSHHPQEVLLAQFSLYVHKGGLKPDSFHFSAYQARVGHILTNNNLHRHNVWSTVYHAGRT